MGYDSTISTCLQTLADLKSTYLDMYLIHWPGKSKLQPEDNQHSLYRKETWRAFEDLHRKGLVYRNLYVL